MKSSLRQFPVKQKSYVSLFIGIMVFAVSVAVGLRVDATPMPTQTLSGSITASRTLDAGYVYVIESQVLIESGATLTIPPGAIVKYGTNGRIVAKQGSVVRVTGIAANPVYFTSLKDDTVGGDTNGDGGASLPSIDDCQNAIIADQGEINIVFGKFSYVGHAIMGDRSSGAIVVTDSTFNNGKVAIVANAPTVKLYRNTFGSLEPYNMEGSVRLGNIQDLTKVSLSGIDQNIFTGTAKFSRIIRINQATLPVGKSWSPAATSGATVYFFDRVYVNGTMTMGSDTSMILQSNLAFNINNGGTLTVQNGAWVKYAGNQSSINVEAAGKLYISGNTSKPVHFTSIKDDSVGGDTNGDGTATAPVVGDFNNAIITSNGYANVVFAKFRYATLAVSGTNSSESLVITDSEFTNGNIAMNVSAPVVKLYRNIIGVSPLSIDGAIQVMTNDLSKIALSGQDSNVFLGNNSFSRIAMIRGSQLPADKSWSASTVSGAIPFFYWTNAIKGTATLGSNTVSIVSHSDSLIVDGTLNIQSGAVVKYNNQSHIELRQGASLNVSATMQNKVYFTSLKDDTVGGDTNGDGAGTVPGTADYNYAILSNDGSVQINHANFKYGDLAVYGIFDSAIIRDCSFSNSRIALALNTPIVVLERNNINVSPQDKYGAVHVTGANDMSGVSLTGANQNLFGGSSPWSKIMTIESSILPSGKTFAIAPSSGAVLRFTSFANIIDGTFTLVQNSQVFFDSTYGAKLNVNGVVIIEQGVIIKSKGGEGFNLLNTGKLNVLGAATEPVIFTSLYDDTVGGDTNGDGTATTPSNTDANSIVHSDSGTEITMNRIKVSYATSPFMVSGKIAIDGAAIDNTGNGAFGLSGGEATLKDITISNAMYGLYVWNAKVIFRGSFSGLQGRAITACNWGSQNCTVDAAYTDWGSTGPTASLVCGQVTTSPWYAGGSTATDGLFRSKNCDGSPTPSEKLTTSTSNFSSRMSIRGIDCSNGFQDACQAIVTAQNCLGAATTLAASTSSFPLPNGNAYQQPAQWGSMLADNASTYIQSIEGPVPALSAASFGMNLLSAVSTVMNVANAYDTCAP